MIEAAMEYAALTDGRLPVPEVRMAAEPKARVRVRGVDLDLCTRRGKVSALQELPYASFALVLQTETVPVATGAVARAVELPVGVGAEATIEVPGVRRFVEDGYVAQRFCDLLMGWQYIAAALLWDDREFQFLARWVGMETFLKGALGVHARLAVIDLAAIGAEWVPESALAPLALPPLSLPTRSLLDR